MTRGTGQAASGRSASATARTAIEITLTGSECRYLAYELSADDLWPGNMREQSRYPAAGGPEFRLQFIRLVDAELDQRFTFRFTESELWLLDSLLLPRLRNGKLPDGTPVESFARKVWSGLTGLHAPRVDALLDDWHAVLRKGFDDADDQNADAVPFPHTAGRAPADGSQRGP